jgi:hypothetical protein
VFGGDDGGGEAVTVGGTTCGTTVTVIPALGWCNQSALQPFSPIPIVGWRGWSSLVTHSSNVRR